MHALDAFAARTKQTTCAHTHTCTHLRKSIHLLKDSAAKPFSGCAERGSPLALIDENVRPA